jgi:choline dehydrogenase-like flavoprotein
VNWQTSLRTPDFIRDEWAEASGVRAFADETFTRSLDSVCERLGVGTGESQHNANNSALERGCASLGYRSSVIPRNAKQCDPAQCGFCVFGCRVGGKQSTTVTYLADAQRAGKTAIVASCRANALVVKSGRVTGVQAVVTNPDGTRVDLRVKAQLVVVAAGALETPALLMRTGIEHEQLGRNLFLHPTSAVGAEYPEPIRGWMGAPQTALCDHFAQIDGNFGFRIETPPIHPGLFAMAIPWAGARDHRAHMRRIEHFSAFIVLTRDRNGGTVRVDREGRAVSRYALDGKQRAIVRRGIAEAARVHWAAGATRLHTVHTRPLHLDRDDPRADIDAYCAAIERAPVHANRSQLFSAHQMGTCRMGTDERTSVCDENGAVRGVRGLYVADTSLFPASSGVNPMITVMALAHMLGARLTAKGGH